MTLGDRADDWVPTGGYITIACKSAKRYFDLDAVRTEIQHPNTTHTLGRVSPTRGDFNDPASKPLENNPLGAPPLDWFIDDDEPQTLNSEGNGMSLEYRVGDVFDRLAEIPDGSIDLIVTSPPFLALRSYLPADHPDKGREIGSEATPADFLDTLLALTAEWGRVLAPHGSLCVELGDTYANTGGQAIVESKAFPWREAGWSDKRGENGKRLNNGPGWPLTKSLTGIPTLYPWSLAYNRNLLTGQPSPAGQWRIRNLIVWARPNPPVGALGDKFRPATSYITVACRGVRRYFDLDAVRGPISEWTAGYADRIPISEAARLSGHQGDNTRLSTNGDGLNQQGAPPLDWHTDHHPEDGDWLWKMSTQPYAGSHYATFPMALPKRLIEAMCPLRVCTVCGRPSERIVETTQLHNGKPRGDAHDLYTRTRGEDQPRGEFGPMPDYVKTGGAPSFSVSTTTLGWSDCGHNQWRTGIVLDPFAGSGTTLDAAQAVGRHAIGIDLDSRNADLARERVGMFLEIVDNGAPPGVMNGAHNSTGNPRFRVGYQHGNPAATGDKKAYGS